MMDYIPQIQPWIDHSELDELKKVIESTYITENEAMKEFEKLCRELTGAKHAVAYANGTLGLAAALMIKGLSPEDEVIVPNLTFIATANSVILAGGKPVLCDVDGETWQMDPESVKSKITKNTRGIMPVHFYGSAVDMQAILKIAKDHNLFVIEDAAQGIGVYLDNKHVGTFAELGMISFYGNKTITTAEGAIMLTDDDDLAVRLYQMKNHGRSKKGVFIHETMGYNFSFSDLHAAIGISQMKKLPKILEKKLTIYNRYKEGLSGVSGIKFSPIASNIKASHWFTNIEVPDAGALAAHLHEKNIGSRRFFYPLHKQPCYEGRLGTDADFPRTVNAYEHGLSLPSSYGLTDEQLDYVIQTIRDFYL